MYLYNYADGSYRGCYSLGCRFVLKQNLQYLTCITFVGFVIGVWGNCGRYAKSFQINLRSVQFCLPFIVFFSNNTVCADYLSKIKQFKSNASKFTLIRNKDRKYQLLIWTLAHVEKCHLHLNRTMLPKKLSPYL